MGAMMPDMASRLAVLAPSNLTHPARTLRELVPMFITYFERVRRRADATVRAYQSDLSIFLTFCDRAGLTFPHEVKPQHIEIFMGSILEERNLQANTVNRYVAALRAFWRWMHKYDIDPRNPALLADLLKVPKRMVRFLSIPQQEQLFAKLAADRSPRGLRDYAIVATFTLTGLRCAELARLQLADLDLEAGGLSVIQGKGAKDRAAVVVPELAAILTRYLTEARPVLLDERHSEYVFVHATWLDSKAGQPIGTRGLWYLISRTIKRVLDVKCSPHKLRHSFASRVRENGGTLQDLQEQLGHASIATTARYAHLLSATQKARMTALIMGTAATIASTASRRKRSE